MKGVVGVDLDGTYRLGVDLFSRLKFDPHVTAELIHVEEPPALLFGGLAPYHTDAYWAAEAAHHETGEALLSLAQVEVAAADIGSSTLLGMGDAGQTLARRADETHADLIVIGSSHKNKTTALLLGSVGRALTIHAHRSILIAKHEVKAVDGLTAVFATDCSEYADECIRLLMRMRPHGISHFVIVTAVNKFDNASPPPDILKHVASLQEHLRQAYFSGDARIVEGDAATVIDETMAETKADLLIVASPHHGTLERMVIGSLSLRETVSAPHSLLLLRP